MVFSSIPTYFDPSNWQQQQNLHHHQIIGSTGTNPLLPPPAQPGPQPPPPQPLPHGAGSPGSIRPGSMSERARMANVPLPETALKCPRCDSTNTKFCYFNNYSLSQPRHFCKTCRRYWTRGGALRNVPVGGGCRRNKRSKSSTSSKSPGNRGDGQATSSSTSSMSTNSGATAANILGLTPPQLTGPLRFMSPLSQLTDSFTNDMGLNYSTMTSPMVGPGEMSFHSNLLGGSGAMANLLSSGIEPWRLQQFPFLGGGGGLDSSQLMSGIYQFPSGESGFVGASDGSNNNNNNNNMNSSNQMQMRGLPKFSSSMMSQIAAVKMEESQAELNRSRQMLSGGMAAGNGNNDHQWNGSGGAAANWTDLSSFSSSSTSTPNL